MKRVIFAIYILCCLLLCFSSCAIRPDGVLSSGKMVNVLVDLHSAEGVLQLAGYNYGHDDEVRLYYGMILAEHGVTQAQFDSSLVWYTDHPQYFQRVYPKVIKRLQQRHDTQTALLTAQDNELKQLLADSLSRTANDSAYAFMRLPEGTIIMSNGTVRLPADAVARQYREGLDIPFDRTEPPIPLCTEAFINDGLANKPRTK